MSEYQYYEFQALDRPLTAAEQRDVSALSSRVSPHPRRAVFTYSYSDFPRRAGDVLGQYFDAMFYISNWGSVRLMFRFPEALLDVRRIGPYCLEDAVDYDFYDGHVILDIEAHELDMDGWIEGDGHLDRLVVLRDDILRGDYRVLYLAWLMGIDGWDVSEEAEEPPVPAGLSDLTPALQHFVELFQIDPARITAAAGQSTAQPAVTESELRQKIAGLSRAECDAWLLRLATGEEPHLALTLRQALLADANDNEVKATPTGRTVADLLAAAEAEAEQAQQRQQAAAEAARVAELEALAAKAEVTWTFALQLLDQGYSQYAEATQLLARLHELAQYQDRVAEFTARFQPLRQKYERRKGLLRRFDEAGLP